MKLDKISTEKLLLAKDRFWSKVNITSDDDCWLWIANINKKGYGTFWLDGSILAHQYVYATEKGSIQSGYCVDHVCHNDAAEKGLCDGGVICIHRSCMNPKHLEVVTFRENSLRSPFQNGTKPFCKHGHKYTEDNTLWALSHGKKEKRCKNCRQIANHKWSITTRRRKKKL